MRTREGADSFAGLRRWRADDPRDLAALVRVRKELVLPARDKDRRAERHQQVGAQSRGASVIAAFEADRAAGDSQPTTRRTEQWRARRVSRQA